MIKPFPKNSPVAERIHTPDGESFVVYASWRRAWRREYLIVCQYARRRSIETKPMPCGMPMEMKRR